MQLLASQEQHCYWFLAVVAEGDDMGDHLLDFDELLGEGTVQRLSDPVLIETLNETDLCKSSWLWVISKSSTCTQIVESEMIYRENGKEGSQARERANA